MKHLLTISLLVAGMVISSCKKTGETEPQPPTPEDIPFSITASFLNDQTWPESEEDGRIFWNPGDEINVFYVQKAGKLTSTLKSPSTESVFSGDFKFEFGSEGGGKYLWAIYPYNEYAQSDENVVLTTLPSSQTGKEGSFAKEMNISVAMSETPSFKFRFVCSGIRFSVTRDDVKQVVLRSRDRETLAGDAVITFEAGEPVVKKVYNEKTSITLNAPGNGTFKAGKWYYIVTLPGTLKKGFWLTFNTQDKTSTYNHFNRLNIKRTTFESFPEADKGLEYSPKPPEPADNIIRFRDPEAKNLCMWFDQDGDGELSYDELAAAKGFPGMVSAPHLKYFDEFKYMTGMTEIPDYLFQGCFDLRSITIPEGIKTIGKSTFENCEVLESVTFAGDVLESIGNNAFAGCKALSSITLPPDMRTIGNRAFSRCTSLESIVIPDSVKALYNEIFMDCTALTSVSLPDDITDIPEGMFSGCSSLTEFTFPERVMFIRKRAFDHCVFIKDGVSRLDIPSTVTSIESRGVPSVMNILLHSTSPVSIEEDAFGGYSRIFVPSSLIDEYASNPAWKEYSGRIHTIDEYPLPPSGSSAPAGTVDLGLSVFWAEKNIGADSPEDSGIICKWGETEPAIGHLWSDYKWSGGEEGKLTKYNTDEKYGEVDNKTVLDPEDDFATATLGKEFRIPTSDEFLELADLCTWKVVHVSEGRLPYFEVTSKLNGNSIILNQNGHWTSDLFEEDPLFAISACRTMDYDMKYAMELELSQILRDSGLSVRPVAKRAE